MKKIVLMIVGVVIVGSGLRAQKRDTLYSEDKSLTDGFIGLSPNGDSTFRIVQVEAKFPGGLEKWQRYLAKNLDASLSRYIPIPEDDVSVKQTALVEFKIDTVGNVVDVSVVNAAEINPNLTREARRVITDSPKWIPAWQNGHHVYYKASQSLSWVRNR